MLRVLHQMGPKLNITSAHIWLKVTMTISKLMSSALNDFPAWESFINASYQQKFEKQFISRLDLDPVPLPNDLQLLWSGNVSISHQSMTSSWFKFPFLAGIWWIPNNGQNVQMCDLYLTSCATFFQLTHSWMTKFQWTKCQQPYFQWKTIHMYSIGDKEHCFRQC